MNGAINSSILLPSAADRLDLESARPGDAQDMEEAGREFEALLLTQLLKSARQASSAGWMGEGEGFTQGVAMELAETQLARAMAEGGALGLAGLLNDSHRARPVESTEPVGDATPPEEASAPTPSKPIAGS